MPVLLVDERVMVELICDGVHHQPVIAAMATILINLAALRRSRWIPPILMAVIGGTAITWLAAGLLGAQPATVEALPGALPPLSLPDLRQVPNLVLPALVMTLLAVTEGVFDRVPLERVAAAERAVREQVAVRCSDIGQRIVAGESLSDADREALLTAARLAVSDLAAAQPE